MKMDLDEFWIGLRSMHCLTSQGNWELRIDYHLINGTKLIQCFHVPFNGINLCMSIFLEKRQLYGLVLSIFIDSYVFAGTTITYIHKLLMQPAIVHTYAVALPSNFH